MEDPELQHTIDRLYSQYKDVFDLVIERKSNTKTVVGEMLKNIYISVLEELGRDGVIMSWDSYETAALYLGFSTKRMNEYLPYEDGVVGTWGSGTTYHYWVYPNNGFLDPTVKLELGPKGHSESLIKRMDALRSFAKPNWKSVDAANQYRRIKSIPNGYSERDSVSPEEIDAEKIRQLLRTQLLK